MDSDQLAVETLRSALDGSKGLSLTDGIARMLQILDSILKKIDDLDKRKKDK